MHLLLRSHNAAPLGYPSSSLHPLIMTQLFFARVFKLAALLLAATCSCRAYVLKCPNLRDGEYHVYPDEEMVYEGGMYGNRDKFKLPIACESASDNTRGAYTSVLQPCVFSFHKSETDDADGSGFRTSTVCSDENRINKVTIKEYVRQWPDECVGDFARCYAVNKDEDIFRNFFCRKTNWKIPEDTTHISVSCMDDKEAKIVHNQNKTSGGYNDPYAAQQEKQFLTKIEKEEEHMRHLETIAVVSFLLSFSACLILVKCAYSNLLRPYYEKVTTHED